MMSSWKLTKKLKDFSRSKSPAPKDKEDGAKPTSSATNNTTNQSSSTPTTASSVKSSTAPSIKSDATDATRRDTVTPSALQVPESRQHPSSSTCSDKTVNSNNIGDGAVGDSSEEDSANGSRVALGTAANINPFKPGLLTVKIYTGSKFKIPFDLSYDKAVFTKLVNCASNPHTEEVLINRLNSLSLNDDRLEPKESSSLIPSVVTVRPSIIKSSLIYFTLEFDKTIASIDPEHGTIHQPTFNKISQFDVTKVKNELKFQVFLRLPSILFPNESDSGTQKNHQDILISSKTIDLSFENVSTPIRIKNHDAIHFDNEYPGFPSKTNGEVLISIDFKPNENKHLTIDDFDLLKVIGKGSFGKVMQVRKKDSGKIYALKALRKTHIVSRSEVTHTLAERTVLARVDNPFIVPLKFSFQSAEKLYFVLSFINGGELFYHLQKEGKFELSRARFYTCELLSALECLHSLDVIYRDLKPENILLDYKGHIALCDFGLCKLNMKNQDKTNTFCGTPEYLAPELLLGHGYTKAVDWWTLGTLLYEMLTGLPPYYDEDVPTMYRKILTNPLKFPDNFDKDAKDLLIGLLSRDPKQRLGAKGAKEIQDHKFFKMIDWVKLNNKGYLPPFKPPVKDSYDTSNFDKEFTNEQPVDSVMNDYLSDSVQKQFGGWTYVGTEQMGDSLKRD